MDKALHANYQWQVPAFKINNYGFPTQNPNPLPHQPQVPQLHGLPFGSSVCVAKV